MCIYAAGWQDATKILQGLRSEQTVSSHTCHRTYVLSLGLNKIRGLCLLMVISSSTPPVRYIMKFKEFMGIFIILCSYGVPYLIRLIRKSHANFLAFYHRDTPSISHGPSDFNRTPSPIG